MKFYNFIILGTFFSNLANFPLETLLVKFQTYNYLCNKKKKFLTIFEISRKIFKYEGILGFYRGFGTAVVYNGLGFLIFYTFYRNTKLMKY